MSRLAEYAGVVAEFVDVCHELSANKFVTSHGGNLSCKLADDLLLITPTRVNKGEIEPEDVVFINMAGARLEGKHEPTGETPMYLNFYRKRPDIVSVIHCHPPLATAFAITSGTNLLTRPVLPEPTIEVGPVPVVPYAVPLSTRLADNFTPFLQKYNAFLMANHGLVMMTTRGIKWAMMLTEILEMTAESVLKAQSLGGVSELSRRDVEELDAVMKTRKLPMFGAPGANGSLVGLYF